MGFASGSVSYQRFHVTGKMPKDVDDAFVKALNERSFGRIPPATDQTQYGWIGPGHLFETEIAAERIAFGDYVHVALRIDKLKVPPAILKSYVRQEEEVALQVSGREFLSKFERKKAREAAILRAEQESRDGRFRRAGAVGVLIDLAAKHVYLGNTSTAVADRLMAVFSDTFGVVIEPETSGRLASRLTIAAKNGRALENLEPMQLVRPPDGHAPDETDFVDRGQDFLGKEFLTWLWFRTDADDGPLRIAGGNDVTVMIDKSLRLKCDFGLTGSTMISADHPVELPEAKAALRIGKSPNRAGVVLGSGLGEFRLSLEAQRWTIGGLTLPEPPAEETDVRTRLENRFEQIADVAGQLDALYDLFLSERIGAKWSTIERAMQKWAAGRNDEAALRAG